MKGANQPLDADIYAEELARLAELLLLEVSQENLSALSNQLKLIDELEEDRASRCTADIENGCGLA